MFKALGNFLHKTPWWALVLLGFSALLLLALFSTPFHLIRLSESGETPEQRRAIKREIDHAFGDTALSAAEQVVKAMRARAQDPARKTELDQALRDIAEARRDIFSAQRDANQSVKDAMRAAAETARQTARDAAEATRDAARDRINSLKEARNDAIEAQKKAGIDDKAAVGSFDKLIAEAELNEKAADQALASVNSSKFVPEIEKEFKLKIQIDEKAARSTTPLPGKLPAPIGPKSGGSQSGGPPSGAGTPPTPPAPVVDGVVGKQRMPGNIVLGGDDKPVLQIDQLGSMAFDAAGKQVPLPPLPPEFRDDIRTKVQGDFRRIGIGSALILTFIPLFIMLLVAKYLIDRSRRAQAFAEVKKQEAESANVNRQIVEARLQALQAQVEPHFLYNTLANVQALTEVDPPQANKMVGHLIQYLRAALPKMRETTSTVGQEVELVRAYLNILRMRMGERLAFEITVPTELESIPFPPLMLPSLVENAIKHGLEPQREGGRIDVIAEKIGERIRLVVKDTGRGLSAEPTQAGSGIGLSNIRERLQALFGESAKLILESNTPQGMVATIEVPMVAIAQFGRTVSVANKAAGMGAGATSAGRSVETPPSGLAARTWWVARKTHGVWLRVLKFTLIAAMILLGVILLLGLTGVATGLMPLQFGNTPIQGMEGMALGSVALLLAFAVLAVVAVILTVIIYGLGMLFAGLLVVVPLIILVSLIPALSPFLLLGLLVWWLVRRNKKKKAGVI